MTLDARIRQLEKILMAPDTRAHRDREVFEVMLVVARQIELIGGAAYREISSALPSNFQHNIEDDNSTKERIRHLVVTLLHFPVQNEAKYRMLWERFAPTHSFPYSSKRVTHAMKEHADQVRSFDFPTLFSRPSTATEASAARL